MTEAALLTPQAAAMARELEFFARTRVEGFLKSVNASKLKGQSTDFLSHRQYQHGDDLRHLDWRVFARSDRLVIREYEEYTNVDVIFGLDYSGSMGYGQGEQLRKIDYLRHLAAMLAYLFNIQKDRCGIAILRTTVAHLVKPGSGKRHLAEVFRHLVAHEPEGETDLDACIRQLIPQIRRRCIFFILSDCYQDPDQLTKAVGMLRLRGSDVVLYQVYAPHEEELPFSGFTLFRDLEDGQIDAADPLEIREAYRQVVAEHTERLQAGCNRFGIEFSRLSTGAPWDISLADLLRARTRR